MWIHRTVEVQDGDKLALLLPGMTPRITVSIDFVSRAVGAQSYSLELNEQAFSNEVAGARTFGFKSQLEEMNRRGLALGGSLRNAILVDGHKVVNEEGLRFDDEFVRHKVLDCLGDLSLAGVPIIGHFYAHKPGHALNQALLSALFTQPDAWSYLSVSEFNGLFGGQQAQAGGWTGAGLPPAAMSAGRKETAKKS
jgi:UDP-3-O-[3-hydroxymyristoyl] N-acetylglucosamine deacetylase